MAVNFKLPAIPFQDKLSGEGGIVSAIWNRYLTVLVNRVLSTQWIVANTSLTAQAAAITSTAIGPALPAGLYSASYYARITQAASVSSSLTAALTWTDGGVSQSYSGSAITGNTTASSQSQSVPLIKVDAGSTVQYSTAYSTSGATPMQYALSVVLYRVGEL